MTSLVINDLEDSLEEQLRRRAARHGHTIEEEVRMILTAAFREHRPPDNLADLAEELFGDQGFELDPHPASFKRKTGLKDLLASMPLDDIDLSRIK
jgi:plasmid stability protein